MASISTEQYLAQLGVSMNAALDFVIKNLGNLQYIIDVCKTYGVTTPMLADIIQPIAPSATSTDIQRYCSGHGYDATILDGAGGEMPPSGLPVLTGKFNSDFGELLAWGGADLDIDGKVEWQSESISYQNVVNYLVNMNSKAGDVSYESYGEKLSDYFMAMPDSDFLQPGHYAWAKLYTSDQMREYTNAINAVVNSNHPTENVAIITTGVQRLLSMMENDYNNTSIVDIFGPVY